MKKIFCLIVSLLWALAAWAQTAEEIISRMEQVMESQKGNGMSLVVDVKIPILGNLSTQTYMLGKKVCVDARMKDFRLVSWGDGETTWVYDSRTEKVEIKKGEPLPSSSTSGNGKEAEMFTGIADGYDVSISKETPEAWYILCKKSRDNKEKDDPKTIDLVIAKGSYHPVSLSTKLSGVALTLRDVVFGVSEKQVTFDPADYPNATIDDKR